MKLKRQGRGERRKNIVETQETPLLVETQKTPFIERRREEEKYRDPKRRREEEKYS